MELPVFSTLWDGLNMVKKNPILFLPLLIISIVDYFVSSSLLMSVITLPINMFFFGMAIRMSYNAATKKKISVKNAAETTAKMFIDIILATLLSVLVVACILAIPIVSLFINTLFSAIAFIIAIPIAMFVGVKIFFYGWAILIDNAGAVNSLKKSWKITKGNWWRIFWLSFLPSLVYLPVIILISIPLILGVSQNLVFVLFYALSTLIAGWSTVSMTVAYMKLKK